MTCEHETNPQVCEKILPNLPEILFRFSTLLQQEYGISGFSVVEFKLHEVEFKLDDSLPERVQLLVNDGSQEILTCCWDCDSNRCYGQCPPPN